MKLQFVSKPEVIQVYAKKERKSKTQKDLSLNKKNFSEKFKIWERPCRKYAILKQPIELFYRTDLKNYAIFTGKQLCWSLF